MTTSETWSLEAPQADADGFIDVDPATEPEAARALVAGATEVKDPLPLPPAPPDDILELSGGYLGRDGRLVTTVRLRELTGEDEEDLARPANLMSPVTLVDTIVRRCVVDLGGTVTPTELDTLLIGDREDIVRKVRIMTYGAIERLNVVCPTCRHAFQIDYNVAATPDGDVPVKRLTGDRTSHERTVPLSKGGSAVVRLIDGSMQKLVYGVNDERNAAELSTLMLHESLVSIRGTRVTSIDQVRAMKAADRRDLRRFLAANDCGPQWGEVTQDCPQCRENFPVTVDLVSLFQ